ncbi:hypothetical protein GGR54DRAFT_142567 [Hypoxylon sp. NC1633]|nr:hypothetical protein GGR54DRAFT_142567 [Hypoxylon sp. NC1633]
MANIRDSYKENYNITDDDIEKFLQQELDRKNALAAGAQFRKGHLTIKDERMAEMLKKEEEKRSEKEKEKKWIEILDPSNGNSYAIEVIRDRCSTDNFVTEHTVAYYSLETLSIGPTDFSDVAGLKFTCYKRAAIHWKGKGGEMRVTHFYVVPDESPIRNALVGKEFDDSFGSILLDSEPHSPIAYTAQKPKTAEEDEQIQAMRQKVENDVARSSHSRMVKEQEQEQKQPQKGEKKSASKLKWFRR